MHLDPDRLLDQADALINNHTDETDLRRAVSAAYYGVFHRVLKALADWIVGSGNRSTERYVLVYRSVDHKVLKALCDQIRTIRKAKAEATARRCEPPGGFGTIEGFAVEVLNLHELRELADYHPAHPFNPADTLGAVSSARSAVANFDKATPEQREAFLTGLVFKSR